MGILAILGYVFMLVGFVGFIIVVIHAFKTSVAQGFLTLCIFPYTLYYAFAKFQHSKKGLIIALFLGGYIIGYGLYFAGARAAVGDALKAQQELLQKK